MCFSFWAIKKFDHKYAYFVFVSSEIQPLFRKYYEIGTNCLKSSCYLKFLVASGQ